MATVLVIGAGVVGASVALRMAEGGARVTVLEGDRVAGGTSTRSFAWNNAHNKLPRGYFELNLAGMRANAALREEFEAAAWFHAGGCVEWAATEEERSRQEARMHRLRAWGYAAEWIDEAQLRALEPDIDPAAVAGAPVAYYPEEGWLDPGPLIRCLLARMAARGGKVRTGARVTDIVHHAGAARGVLLESGERLAADVVVNCTGAATNSVTPDPALHVPMASTRGLLAVTAPAPVQLSRVVQGPGGTALRPDGAGRVMIHSTPEDGALTADTPVSSEMPAAGRMAKAAARMLPELAGVPVEAVRIADRPIPRDGHPVVGELPALSGYHVVVTHSGVTLGCLLGRAVADEVLHGRHHSELDAFRPARFFGAAA